MFFGMMLLDASLAAWAVGVMQQPAAPRWVRWVIAWLGVTLLISVGGVLLAVEGSNPSVEKNASLIGPFGAAAAFLALAVATAIQRRRR